MRLLMDANLSPKRIGSRLQRRGHDVLSRLIWTFGHHESGAIISGVERLLLDLPDAKQWRDLAVAL